MDSDISSAANALDLAKLRAQEDRDWKRSLSAVISGQIEWLRTEFGKMPSDVSNEFATRRAVVLAVADKYMTTSTATLPDSILADAQKDAARLKAGVDAVMELLK